MSENEEYGDEWWEKHNSEFIQGVIDDLEGSEDRFTLPMFGVWIKQQRHKMDWTYEELAERLGMEVKTLIVIEQGDTPTQYLSDRFFKQLAEIFDIEVSKLTSVVCQELEFFVKVENDELST